ncbi:hypothetical protein [Tumebacillus flagellatus]|uniref:Uncharacterized protein n=1 Tax=Tumebacillus flagellatus TaxID=1157490 RepID=A0A074LWR7_9BACL|nr:hypothetical protein [Tumebacillus flagellatus]KEO84533.1 hypothetical protein EL26_03170 [Tumebacillus flagellatus]
MEGNARNCGVTIHQRCRAPYLLGCLLPHTLIRPDRLLSSSLEARVTFANGFPALELHAGITDLKGHLHRFQFVVSYLTHQEFIMALMEASTLYLLTGTDHPVSLDQRVHDGGVAVEITEAFREQLQRPVLVRQHA